MHTVKPAEPTTAPTRKPVATDPSEVTTEFRSSTLAEIQSREEARETERLNLERLAAQGPVAGMD